MAEDKEKKVPQEETPEQLKAKIADLEKASAEKDQLLEEAHKSISASENAPASGRPEFTYKGDKYILVVPKSTVKRGNQMITVDAKSLKKDKDMLEYLIKDIKSGILVKASDLASKKKED